MDTELHLVDVGVVALLVCRANADLAELTAAREAALKEISR